MQMEIQSHKGRGPPLPPPFPPLPSQNTATTPLTTQNMSQELPITTATAATTTTTTTKKLTLIPLIFLIYFEVAGGPYGEEPAVKAGGPLLAILGFLIFPFIWSIPEALITAELCTAFPGNGGFVIWADAAFGPFFGSLMGTWKLLSGIINVAAFPALCIDYLQLIFPIFSSGLPRYLAIFISTLLLSFLNYTGLTIVGYAAVILGVVSLLPFILMSLIAIPKIHPHRWLSLGQKGVKKDWNLFFNTLFWNLNFWDNVSTLAGEVDKPQKNFPLGLFSAVIFTCLAYIIPLLAVTGSVSVDQNQWDTGFMADAAEIISGKWLKFWIEVGAVLSTIGLFEAQLSSSAYQVLGMAELAFLPKVFGLRSKWFNTPWVGILLSTVITLAVSHMTFTDIISSANFLYSLGMLLEFASFVWLRRKFPAMKRPYRVPMKLPGLIIMCLIPSGFLVFIMAIATKIVYLVSGLMTVAGIGWYFLMKYCKQRRWIEFNNGEQRVVEE
ncbi:probable polyamine transporter At3g13620 [Camellia sinensis]|nr:probable polyamine transporter At3g13620 [Camellia sinensis]